MWMFEQKSILAVEHLWLTTFKFIGSCACCRHSLKLLRAMDSYKEPYLFVDVASPRWAIMHINEAVTQKTGAGLRQPRAVLAFPLPVSVVG